MILYAISDRRMLARERIDQWAAELLAAGVDWVQIREKDLDGGALLATAREVRSAASRGRVLINERCDIAIAAGLDGVHLPADSIGAAASRRVLPGGSLVGVSCHSREEVSKAEEEGADFVVFGPVFETASKKAYGPPRGVSELAAVCRGTTIPVLALGGITGRSAIECARAGAAGIAGISLFGRAPDRIRVIEELKAL